MEKDRIVVGSWHEILPDGETRQCAVRLVIRDNRDIVEASIYNEGTSSDATNASKQLVDGIGN